VSEPHQPSEAPRGAKVPPPLTREVIRGASADVLARPAGRYLASLRWDGLPGDPDTLSASAFLSRL
jgi:hypothetical protein